ncbi:MAG TPA: phytanoyl-CoA dioxygenase family protein [Actinopolymorphaceae bacterium]
MHTVGARVFDQGGQVYDERLYVMPPVDDHLTSLADIDAQAVSQYHERGLLAVDRALDDVEVTAALDALNHLARPDSPAGIQYEKWAENTLEHLTPEERLDATRKFMDFAKHDARLDALARHPAILVVVETLLGGTPQLFQEMALIKPPGGGREKPWHQDNAFFHLVPGTPIVGVWIALDDATLENGCMRVVPGSHREGPRRHAFLRDLQLCDGDVPIERGVAVPLPSGGLMFFDGLLLHGTPANRTTTRRRALQFHYTVADPETTDDEQHKATFGWVDGAEC